MKPARFSVTIDQELYVELKSYASGIDRTVQNFLIHAARQYMRRYPLERQTSGKRPTVVPEVTSTPPGELRLQDRGSGGPESAG